MKEMRRVLAVFLVLCMVVGFMPAIAFAEEAPLDAAIFCSDVHGNPSTVTSIFNGIKSADSTFDPSTAAFVGDTQTTASSVTSAAQEVYSDVQCIYAFGNHDDEGNYGIEDFTGLSYGDSTTNYYIYTISENDMSTSSPDTSGFTSTVASLDKTKPLFIISHMPLHSRRNDNNGAASWYDAISTAAESMDIFFFWAHNHTGDNEVDRAAYYVAKNGTETMTIQGGSTVTPNFTYANAGYIDPPNTPARNNVATAVRIYDDSVNLTVYNASGELSGTYAVNETVAREFAAKEEVTLSSIAISGTTSYTVGDKLALTVTATYSDGTTADVTADSTFSGHDMNTAGSYTVTAAYGEKTATTSITVADPYVTKIEITTEPTKLTYVTGETLDTTGMVVTATYNNGTTAEVTGWYTSSVDLTTVGEKTVTVNYYVNGNTFKDTYTITVEEGVAEGVTLTGIAITSQPSKTEYLISEELSLDGMVVTATFSDGSTKVIDYAPFATSTVYGGYELDNFSMYVKKQQAVTVTYTFREVTQTASFTINVWDEEFTHDSGVQVTVSAGDYGVTGVNVADSVNAHVASAIEGVIGEIYKAYDITLTTDEGYSLTEGEKTVTLPIPEGVENPVVYYVSDNGETVTNMNATENEDGTVSFTTTHFSTYVVGENALAGEEADATTPAGSSTTTTYSTEEVTVYKLVTTPVSGKSYLIVNSGNGNGYGLDADTTGYATTAFTGGDGYYSAWDSSSNTGTAFAAGSDVYLTTSGAYLWTAGSNAFTIGYDSDSSIGTLVTNYTYTLNPANGTDGTWSLSNNQLSISLVTKDSWFGSDTNTTYYLSGGSTWSMSTTAANVYFYEPVTIYKVTSSTSTVETPETTYHMDLTVDGNAVTDHAYTVTGVESGDTAQLWANFTATANGTTSSTDWPAGGSFTVLSSSNEAVATMGTDGKLTFTGVAGQTLVQVAYTWTVNGVEYTTKNYVIITAQPPVYTMAAAQESVNVKVGDTTTLTATAYADGTAIDGATITWSSSNTAIATVDASTGVVTGVAEGDVTITATYTDPNGTVHTDTVNISVVDAVYALDICKKTENEDGTTTFESITTPIVIKDVDTLIANGTNTHSVWAVITKDGEDIGTLNEDDLVKLTFTSSDESIATVDKTTGVVTFVGGEGTVNITASYEYADGKSVTDTVTFSVTASQYSIPSDGTSDFPEYPNEGSVRFDKTATAVGNFSQTGIAQVELSMTGVPYTTGSEIDVVVMLDMTGSMSTNGMTAAEEATVAFVEKIVKNEDGTYNNNRVAVYAFNSGSSSPYELVSLKKITSDEELATANAAIRTASDKQAQGGTPFDEAAKKCYDVLQAAKTDGTGNNRQQFCVFMSDGGPTTYYGSDEKTYYGGNNNSGDVKLTECMVGYSSSDSADWSFTLPTEYYTDQMKADGVTVYTVGLLLQTAPSNPAPYSSMTDSTYDSTTDSLTTIGSHYYFTSSILKQMATDESKYIDIFNVDNASKATAAFESIAMSILQAATDVTVEDKITDEYTMIFDIPTGSKQIAGLDSQEFYIEFVEYTLNENHERTTETSITKLYLKNTNGVYSAASDSSGTAYAAPVFAQTTIGDKGTLYYWTTDTEFADQAALSYNDGTNTYYFIPYGKEANEDGTAPTGWYNMTSGGYAYGTVDSTTNMSTDLVIATPYFVYNAGTRMLYWTVDKIASTEYALRYFLYLDQSATEIGTKNELPAGPYETNDYAYITYTNFDNSDCRQEFPVPQMTWNGATVSYVFYLVDENGNPINKSGQIVDFANANFITDVFEYTVVWNGDNAVKELNIAYLAADLLPSDYIIYDEQAKYTIHVYQDEAGNSVFDYFIIDGSTADNIASSLNTRLVQNNLTSDTVSVETTKVYNTKAGNKYSEYGTYSDQEIGTEFNTTDADGNSVIITTTKQASLDYSDTTVAFAVVWKPHLVEDVVVVDFGLDVLINVVQNDNLQNTVSGIGIGKEAFGDTEMNKGVYNIGEDTGLLGVANQTINGHTISIENENQIRFHQGSMQFDEPVVFYYESPVSFYEGSTKKEGFLYSSVTVIPATTIYYEDGFVELKTYTSTGTTDADGNTIYTETDGWTINSVAASATQAQDRPGASQISADLDADNNYGYDSAYADMSQHSMDSAAKTTVKSGVYATATFEFYGTGFDVISMTDTTTGVIVVQVYNEAGKVVVNETVNNYYGYAREYYKVTYTYDANSAEWTSAEEKVTALGNNGTAPETPADGDTYTVYETRWVTTTSNDPNALYQVPVLKIGDGDTTEALPYGKYKAVITASYMSFMDKTTAEGYDFYLDAVRIYNPTGNKNETANNAYVTDGEGWPTYYELRTQVINKATFDSLNNESVSGIVFIDGGIDSPVIADYVSYGPNNELYLEAGNAVAFDLNATATAGEVAKIQLAIKTVGNNGSVLVYGIKDGVTTTVLDQSVNTATDMYFDITALNGQTVVIKNDGADPDDAIISITNVKVTYTAEQTTTDSGTETASDDSGLAVASTEETETPMLFSVRRSTADAALATMSVEEAVPETTVPEETEPEETVPEETVPEDPATFQPEELTVSVSQETVKAGGVVIVTVRTSTDVESLTVNGETITRSAYSYRTGTKTWIVTVKAEEVGQLEISVVANNADGEFSEAVVNTVTVEESTGNIWEDLFGWIFG